MPIEVKGRFVHDRYRGVRMPPPEAVLDADERQSMYYDQKVSVYNARELNPAPPVFRLMVSRLSSMQRVALTWPIKSW